MNDKDRDLSRRQAIRNFIYGSGSTLAMRSLATGLPISFLLRPAAGRAAVPTATSAQYLILASSGSGDPMNPYTPGSYLPGIVHATDPRVAATQISVGGVSYTAGTQWTTVPQAMLDRSCFFHFCTQTTSHSDEPKVLALMGNMRRGQMTVGFFGNNVASTLGTTSPNAVSFNENLVASGLAISPMNPALLGTALLTAPGPLANLQRLRDQSLNQINAILQQYGTPAEKTFLDSLVLSQNQVRNISIELLTGLSNLVDNSTKSQMLASCILFAMNAVPATNIFLGWGGDNHTDPGLAGEVTANLAATSSLAYLWQQLNKYGIQDKVLFATLNVFGRTLEPGSENGRDHNGVHQVGLLIGSNVKPGVAGGIVLDPTTNLYSATGIQSTTGQSNDGGDIPRANLLASYGQTIGALCGVPSQILSSQVTLGKVVTGIVSS